MPDELAARPFDEPRKALVPKGWTLSVWARVPKPRLEAWTPDGNLLVSVPSTGQVIRLQPAGVGPRVNLLLDGLDQPHGLAFSGSTLYVAESDQVDAYDYADGNATNPRTRRVGPAGRAQSRPGWRLLSCVEERRRGTRWGRVLLDRVDGKRVCR